MRKSSLFLLISVLAMGSAFWIGEFRPSAIWQCYPRADVAQPSDQARMYEAAISGCFEGALSIANRLLAANPLDQEVRLYRGYALRGLGRHDEAVDAYLEIYAEFSAGSSIEPWVAVDALTGLAAALRELGEYDHAHSMLEAGLSLALTAEAEQASQRTAYQLACLYAQQIALAQARGECEAAATGAAQEKLTEAMRRGYNNLRHIRSDLDLAPLRTLASGNSNS